MQLMNRDEQADRVRTPALNSLAAVGLERFFVVNTGLMVGREGQPPPEHALPALGALMVSAPL